MKTHAHRLALPALALALAFSAPADATGNFVEGPYTYHSLDGVGHWILEKVPRRVETWLLKHLRQ